MSWDTGEMCEFASALVAAMECLGENTPYHYVTGTSGAAFRFTLHPGRWDFTNYSIRNVSPDPYEPVRRAFGAAGYAFAICEPGSRREDATKIMDSIQRGVPVLAFRMVGPSDCCIITGYDKGGDVLLGWSTFQNIRDDHNVPHDATGYFRKPRWHDQLAGYVLIARKTHRPPLREVYLDALRWGVHLVRTPEMGGKHTGLAALTAWAQEMTREEFFPSGDQAVLGQRYVSTAINITMLRDHCTAAPFLAQVAEDLPDCGPELALSAKCYREVKRLRNRMDAVINDNFSPQAMEAIADPDSRRRFAEVILRIREKEDEAATHIERFLARQPSCARSIAAGEA